MRTIHVTIAALLTMLCVSSIQAGNPTTQPFALYSLPRDPQLDRLLKNREDAQKKLDELLQSRDFSLWIRPLPSDQKPQGDVEHWSNNTRPALLHITPNVVETAPGRYGLHQDMPRIVWQANGVSPTRDENSVYYPGGPYRDLIDDRPAPQK